MLKCAKPVSPPPLCHVQDAAVSMLLPVLLGLLGLWDWGLAEAKGEDVDPSTNDNKTWCFSARIRSTVLQGLPFGGVPTVLALDFMCFLVRIQIHIRAYKYIITREAGQINLRIRADLPPPQCKLL